jgi:hypothetical protein
MSLKTRTDKLIPRNNFILYVKLKGFNLTCACVEVGFRGGRNTPPRRVELTKKFDETSRDFFVNSTLVATYKNPDQNPTLGFTFLPAISSLPLFVHCPLTLSSVLPWLLYCLGEE